MIIGVSGKIGSGKDTVGKIIQYLIDDNEYPIEKVIEGVKNNKLEFISNWQIKKFASKLKQCVAIMTGCNVEDLEKQEFKDSYLDDNWNINFNQAIGALTNINNDKVIKLTYRKFLQLFGTEIGRQIHPNTWVNALFADYIGKDYSTCNCPNNSNREFCPHMDETVYPNWIITDVRFPNEFDAIKEKGGINIRVERLIRDCNNCNIKSCNLTFKECKGTNIGDKTLHVSETALDNTIFDYLIDNNGTIDELIEQVKQILIKEKIL